MAILLIVGIDPSSQQHKRAWAGVEDGRLIWTCARRRPAILRSPPQCIACEAQWINPDSDVPARNIVKLAFAAGWMLGEWPNPPEQEAARIVLPVHVWKGAVFPGFLPPKAVYLANLRDLFGSALRPDVTDDEIDAAGIALAAWKLRTKWKTYEMK